MKLHTRSAPRRRGTTLVEILVAIAVLSVVLGAIQAAFLSISRVYADVLTVLEVESACNRAFRRLQEDLYVTDSLSVDDDERRYVEVRSRDGGRDNVLIVRPVSGFDIDRVTETVRPIVGEEIEFSLVDGDRLARRQGALTTVLAQGVDRVRFAIGAEGIVGVEVTLGAGAGVERYEVRRTLFVMPQNAGY